jgi:hypothetical protein
MLARVAWSTLAVTILFAAADTAMTAAARPLLSEGTLSFHGWPFIPAATIGSAAMGALIVSRYPRHRIGWLLSLIGVAAAFGIACDSYAYWVIEAHGPGSQTAGHLSEWTSSLFGASLTLAALAVMFLIAPDGEFLSRRWRYAGLAALVGLITYQFGVVLTPPSQLSVSNQPAAHLSPTVEVLLNVGALLITAVVAAAAISLILRFRRSSGEARQQLRWIVFAAVGLSLGILIYLVVAVDTRGKQNLIGQLPLDLAFFALPIFTAVAALRYRLYHLDIIINRAAVLTIATVFVAVGYIGLVVAIGAIVGAHTGGFWPSILATAVVALAFQPLRRRVVRIADRLAYGDQAVPYEALAEFSRRLGESPAPDALLSSVAEAACDAVGAETATARLTVPGSTTMTSRWPPLPAGAPDHAGALASPTARRALREEDFAVTDAGESIGQVRVVMPAGRSLRPRDRLLLVDLTQQAALGFRNIMLEAQLINRIQELDRRTAALAESRGRLFAARDAERALAERAIQREVIRHLEGMPEELKRLRDPTVGARTTILDDLITRAVQALESLREITRGIYPTQLTNYGLGPAIAAHLGRTKCSGTLHVEPSADGMRSDRRTEAAAYFCYLEAARDLAAPVEVSLSIAEDRLLMQLHGSATIQPDIQRFSDRLDPLGGTVIWRSTDGSATLTVDLPIQPYAADQPTSVR